MYMYIPLLSSFHLPSHVPSSHIPPPPLPLCPSLYRRPKSCLNMENCSTTLRYQIHFYQPNSSCWTKNQSQSCQINTAPSFQDKHGAEGKVCLGFCVQGIVVYSVHEDVKTQLQHCPWQKIKDVCCAVSGLLDQIVAM